MDSISIAFGVLHITANGAIGVSVFAGLALAYLTIRALKRR